MTRPTRTLAVFAAVFTLGLFLPGSAPGFWVRFVAALACIALTVAFHLNRHFSPRWTTASFILLWFALGWVRSYQTPLHLPKEEVWIEGRVRVPVERKAKQTRLRLSVDRWHAGDSGAKLRIGAVVTLDRAIAVHAGQRIRLIGLLQPMDAARNPGAFDARAWGAMRGIQARITREKSIQVLPVNSLAGRLARVIDSLRDGVDRQMRRHLDPAVVPLVQSVLTGDRSAWSDATRDRLARSGVMHLFAISGLHVGLIAGILISLVTLLRFRKVVRIAVLLAVLWFYVAFTGANPPVLRATVILTLYSVGTLLQRQHRIGYSLLLAWIGLLAWRPLALGDAGFQLTFAGTFGSVWAANLFQDWVRLKTGEPLPRTIRWFKRYLRWVAYSVMISIGAVLASTPFVIAHFGRLPWFGPLVTVIALPLLTGILITGWGTAIFGSLPIVGTLFGDALWALLHILDLLAGSSSSGLPVAERLPLSSAVIAGVVFLLLAAWSPRLKTLGIRGAVIALLVVFTGIAWADAWLPEGKVKVGILDVGQGDAILARRGDKAFLVDCGSGRLDVALNQLRLTGVRQLDLIVLTHGDGDHAGGAAAIVRQFPVRMGLIGPGVTRDEKGREAVQAMLDAGVPVYVGTRGGQVSLGKLGFLDLLWPSKAYERDPRRNDNDLSLILCWRSGGAKALFPGDAGERVERILVEDGNLPDVGLLVAGHHGSRYSTTTPWLIALRPEVVAISAGRGNPYGHPSTEALKRIGKFDISVRRTDREGAILLIPAGAGFRSLSRQEWW